MVVCGTCGTDNPEGVQSCIKCGAAIPISRTSASPEPKPFEDIGKLGQEFGKKADAAGKDFGLWWDRRLGILAPFVSGAIGLIVLLVVIVVVRSLAVNSEPWMYWQDIQDFINDYVWLLVIMIFYGSFTSYFNRRYRKHFKWVNPIFVAVGFVVWLWIFAELLDIAAVDLVYPSLGHLADLVRLMLPVVFILVLVLGYITSALSPAIKEMFTKRT